MRGSVSLVRIGGSFVRVLEPVKFQSQTRVVVVEEEHKKAECSTQEHRDAEDYTKRSFCEYYETILRLMCGSLCVSCVMNDRMKDDGGEVRLAPTVSYCSEQPLEHVEDLRDTT